MQGYSRRVETDLRAEPPFSWKRTLALGLLPGAAVVAYMAWSKGGAFLYSGRFYAIIAIVFVPEIAAQLASGFLKQAGRRGAGAAVGLLGRLWLVVGVLWLVLLNNPIPQ
jgi:hypothetical protein